MFAATKREQKLLIPSDQAHKCMFAKSNAKFTKILMRLAAGLNYYALQFSSTRFLPDSELFKPALIPGSTAKVNLILSECLGTEQF